jgi:hypothetical protein
VIFVRRDIFEGRVREKALDYAMRIAVLGTDAQELLAVAQLYEDYMLGKHRQDTMPVRANRR